MERCCSEHRATRRTNPPAPPCPGGAEELSSLTPTAFSRHPSARPFQASGVPRIITTPPPSSSPASGARSLPPPPKWRGEPCEQATGTPPKIPSARLRADPLSLPKHREQLHARVLAPRVITAPPRIEIETVSMAPTHPSEQPTTHTPPRSLEGCKSVAGGQASPRARPPGPPQNKPSTPKVWQTPTHTPIRCHPRHLPRHGRQPQRTLHLPQRRPCRKGHFQLH